MVQTHMSNIQLELLKLYASNISEAELLDIQHLMAEYFAKRSVSAADALWDERGLTQTDMKAWLNADHRKNSV
jgi:hypothetical protein